MNENRLNEAPVLDQLEPYWQKIAGLLLYKLAKRGEQVTITFKDMKQLEADWPGGTIIACLGGYDHFSFKLVTPEEAQRLAQHQKTQEGSA